MKKLSFIVVISSVLLTITSCQKEHNFLPLKSNTVKPFSTNDYQYLNTTLLRDTPYGNVIIVDTPYTSPLVDTPYTKK